MNIFLEFLVNHWMLTGTFVVLLAWLFQSGTSKVVKGIQILSVAECVQKINHEHGALIDIREESKFNNGHIVNSVNSPLANLENDLKKIQKYKAKPAIVVCQNGQSSIRGAELLKKNGFDNVNALKGGIQEWLAADLPLVKK